MPTKSCLIVDDSPMIRKVSRRMLEPLRFVVDEAENGQIAVEKCAVCLPELILLDWNMPVMNGIEFLRKLRGTEGGSHPRVIFCTTENDVQHIREAFEAGADEYLIKPFDKDTLQEKLTKVSGITRSSTS